MGRLRNDVVRSGLDMFFTRGIGGGVGREFPLGFGYLAGMGVDSAQYKPENR
jgi:hypothetical protein